MELIYINKDNIKIHLLSEELEREGLCAEKLNYSSENTAKVTKHRCCEKFRSRFNECIKSLF